MTSAPINPVPAVDPNSGQPRPARRVWRQRWVLLPIAALAAGYVAYLAAGMPGMDHGAGSPSGGVAMAPHGAHRTADPAEFAALIDDPDSFILNVHVPNEGNIAGTDLAMAYDTLRDDRLPRERDTPIGVYCRTGSMSAVAAKALIGLGFTDIVELDGGTEAWIASGRVLDGA
jgi:rhodanese-related sulfurtransferase